VSSSPQDLPDYQVYIHHFKDLIGLKRKPTIYKLTHTWKTLVDVDRNTLLPTSKPPTPTEALTVTELAKLEGQWARAEDYALTVYSFYAPSTATINYEVYKDDSLLLQGNFDLATGYGATLHYVTAVKEGTRLDLYAWSSVADTQFRNVWLLVHKQILLIEGFAVRLLLDKTETYITLNHYAWDRTDVYLHLVRFADFWDHETLDTRKDYSNVPGPGLVPNVDLDKAYIVKGNYAIANYVYAHPFTKGLTVGE